MTKQEKIEGSKKCPCVLWFEAYNRLGNYDFYHTEEHKKYGVCMSCKLHIVGHGDWCEYCNGRGEIEG